MTNAGANEQFFYSITLPSTLASTGVLVNTGSTLIQADNDEEHGSELVSKHIWVTDGSTS